MCRGRRGQTLQQLAVKAGVPIEAACGGRGICGKCRVTVIHPDGTREEQLACQYRPQGNMVVEVENLADASCRKEQLLTLPEGFDYRCTPARNGGRYGLAFDIGTTTVVGMLWDFRNQKLVDAIAESNPQISYGADVIARILYADESPEHLREIHEILITSINQMIDTFVIENGLPRSELRYVTVVGNTTMSHLFLGLDPRGLAVAPFRPAFEGAVEDTVSRVGLKLPAEARFLLLPNIAGHVGSDITADILATGMIHSDENNMLVDIGTNGEIVCAAKGVTYVSSTAAGPAFEGAVIKYGMRAANGAIESVKPRSNGVAVRTIGNLPAIGICGSGIIDAVATLLKKGVLNSKGKLNQHYADQNIVASSREYILAHNGDHEITITQSDVREVQLAKGSMRAGMEVLLAKAGLVWEQVDHFYIAGAFGSFVDIESAVAIGLLPDIPRDRFVNTGNAAGVGALMALISPDTADHARKLVGQIRHVELSGLRQFEEKYYEHILFPKLAEEKKEERLSRRQQAIKTKESIYSAAIDLFNRKGYENTTIEDITTQAGTAIGTFYLYYRSKKELVYHTIDKYDDISRELYDRVKGLASFEEQFRTFTQELYRNVEQMGKEILKALYWNNLTGDDQAVNSPKRPVYTRIGRIIQYGLQTGALSTRYPEEYYVEQVIAVLLGIDYYWCSMPGNVDLLKISTREFETLLRSFRHLGEVEDM